MLTVWGPGVYRSSLYFLINFAVNLKSIKDSFSKCQRPTPVTPYTYHFKFPEPTPKAAASAQTLPAALPCPPQLLLPKRETKQNWGVNILGAPLNR